jgi:hypothetical protein
MALLPHGAPALAKSAQEYHLFVWRVTPPGAPADAPAADINGTDTQHRPPATTNPAAE